MITIKLQDGKGTSNVAKVNADGALAVGPIFPSVPSVNILDMTATAFNFVKAKSQKRFIITDIIVNADRFVSVNGAKVEIYEANAVDSVTILKRLLNLDVNRSQTIPITGLVLDVNPGVFLNAKTDSVNINLTISGYFVEDQTQGEQIQ